MSAPSRDDTTLVYSTDSPPTFGHRTTPPASNARSGRGDTRGSDARGAAGPRRDAPPQGPGQRPDGVVRIWLERKGRNGKPVSIIRGLTLSKDALGDLAGRLKRACGTGGSAKDGEIIIQGDHRARLAAELEQDGLRVKLAGG